MNNRLNGMNRLFHGLALVLVATVGFSAISCSGNDADSPDTTAAGKKPAPSAKLQWADMLMQQGDSTQVDWVDLMGDWPATQQIGVDSMMRAQLADLTLAFSPMVYKNLEMDEVPELGGCRVEIIVAGRHVPDHRLMSDFTVDSVFLFRPGDTAPAGRRLLFPARRKYFEGVWQVEFVTSNESYAELDFSEGMELIPHAYVSWRGKSLIFELPPAVYEYIESPQPSAD